MERKNKLSDSVVEKYYVLKSNPEVKVGLYMALLNRRKLVALGNFDNGKKVGVWQFYDAAGTLNEKYNYDEQRFTYEAPMYQSGDFSFIFEDSLKVNDRLTRPLKIGGAFFGFIPYLSIFKLPFDTYDIRMDTFDAYLELLISPMGQLADYKVRIASPEYQYDHIFKMDVNLFSKEDRTFLPATRNGEGVISRILIKCYVTPYGTLDFN